ncbi:hypothetical protein FKM82_024251 [Ascaphus truei]
MGTTYMRGFNLRALQESSCTSHTLISSLHILPDHCWWAVDSCLLKYCPFPTKACNSQRKHEEDVLCTEAPPWAAFLILQSHALFLLLTAALAFHHRDVFIFRHHWLQSLFVTEDSMLSHLYVGGVVGTVN